jgi:hypothetical protein
MCIAHVCGSVTNRFLSKKILLEGWVFYPLEFKLLPRKYNNKEKRRKTRKLFFDENVENDTILEDRENFRINTFLTICDKIIFEISKRSQIYKNLKNKFCVILDNCDDSEFEKSFNLIKEAYGQDLDAEDLKMELRQFSLLAAAENLKTASEKLLFIEENKIVSAFPNVQILLRLYLTLAISNSEGERSFSVLKNIKNYLRSVMSQEKLNSLAILYIEQESFKSVKYDEIITVFIENKIRKKKF